MAIEELKEWLKIQIDASEKLLEQAKDSAKIAEFFFSKLAYEQVLKKIMQQPIDKND